MKNLICLSFALLLLLASCASNNLNADKKKQIAVATQRVGEEYYNNGQYTVALKNLLQAYKTIPDNPYLNNSLGLVYMAKNRYELAENHFKKALDVKPDFISAKNNLGAAYLKQKKWDPAIQCFEKVSQNLLYDTPEMPLSNLGWAYFHQKMYKTAQTYFEKSLEIKPDFLSAVHGLASIYVETGYYPHAVNFLHYAIEKNPSAAILHSDMAKTYEALQYFKKAKKSWKIVLKLVPDTSPLAREAKKRLLELN